MRHHVDHRKLGRTTPHRRAMLANLVSSLVLHDRVETTLPKAKEARRIADKIVTLSKQGTVHARRQAVALIRNTEAVDHAFRELGKRFEGRNGGYTRIYHLGPRQGDAAPAALLEYLRETKAAPVKEEKKPEKKKVAAKKKSTGK